MLKSLCELVDGDELAWLMGARERQASCGRVQCRYPRLAGVGGASGGVFGEIKK